MRRATMHTPYGMVPVTVIRPFGRLNYEVRIEADCVLSGNRPLKSGALYIAGRSSLTFEDEAKK